jgi:hypothetical protein
VFKYNLHVSHLKYIALINTKWVRIEYHYSLFSTRKTNCAGPFDRKKKRKREGEGVDCRVYKAN